MVAAGELEICYDARLLAEYRAVLGRKKFQFAQELIEAFLEQLERRGHLVATTPLRGQIPDEDDRPFAEVAIASDALYLITGNTRHFPARKYGTARVTRPKAFLEHVRGL